MNHIATVPSNIVDGASARRQLVQRQGFTLIELLVAVGAVTLIALGIAQVFKATGDTVRAGRRANSLNEAAALIQRQMRADIASMTRAGFLVIRHKQVGNTNNPNQGIWLTAEQEESLANRTPAQLAGIVRERRVDELMFFAEGRYTSLRRPVTPERTAVGSAARIYYGHGLRQDPTQDAYYDQVDLEDTNDTAALTPTFGEDGPNKYASDWTLLRHVTVLASPSTPDSRLSFDGIPGLEAGEQNDSIYQIGLQPAASSIFRVHAAGTPPSGVQTPGDSDLVRDGSLEQPAFSCGAVDVASVDLPSIRAVVMDAQTTFAAPFNPSADDSADSGQAIAFVPGLATLTAMQRWMHQALPASGLAASDPLTNDDGDEVRMRFEPSPPNYLGTLAQSASGQPFDADEDYRRTDQLMLSASNFVPRCTEFIVEWSFGQVWPAGEDRAGELIWHGFPRYADLDFDGQIESNEDDVVAERYGNSAFGGNDTVLYAVRLQDGSQYVPATPAPTEDQVPWSVVSSRRPDNPLTGDDAMTSTFGFVDPLWTPESTDPTVTALKRGATVNWPWPRLLRVTLSLSDPSDPFTEQTFQFVFEVSANEGRQN